MCLILFAHQTSLEYPLVLLANRDEYHDRPSAAMAFWRDKPDLLAGKDLRAGGTWFGITRSGRYACVTNVRQGLSLQSASAKSRGSLVVDFLSGQQPPDQFLAQLEGDDYAGFNLLLGDASGLYYGSNRIHNGQHGQGPQQVIPARVAAGFHGLSNAGLDTGWPKVRLGVSALHETMQPVMHNPAHNIPDETRLLAILQDRQQASTQDLPDTGNELEWERLLSSRFIQSNNYGTRASYLLMIDRLGKVLLRELSYAPDGSLDSESRFEFNISSND